MTEDFEPVSICAYANILGVSETAANQATRLISQCRDVHGFNVEQMHWAVQSDNTGRAVGVGAALGLEKMRCTIHVLVLGPKHLFKPIKRKEGWVRHENAVPEIYDLMEKIRAALLALQGDENERRRLVTITKRLGEPVLGLRLGLFYPWRVFTWCHPCRYCSICQHVCM